MSVTLKAPFPWFGGKSKAARAVWERFGQVHSYIEPFCGSCAVLLSNPAPPDIETVNDADIWISNFWRSVKTKREEVVEAADFPVSEIDLVARHRLLDKEHGNLVEKMLNDHEWCDPTLAGIWVWGLCAWIGDSWTRKPEHKQLPSLGNAGKGINRTTKLPRREYIETQLSALQARLRNVRIANGQWNRVLGPAVIQGCTAVFLDPPYKSTDHGVNYAGDSTACVWSDVCEWCEQNGGNAQLRIALCGYRGTWEAPEGWEELHWKGKQGMGRGGNRSEKNRRRETIWFSPGCLDADMLF